MNKIEPRTIQQLIVNQETPQRENRVEHYLIPAYQRGYRWTTLHVEALLEDLGNFLKRSEEPGAKNEAYCLQPIVVVAQQDSDGKRIWEIVDGQQRLTTLFILLKYLDEKRFDISFEKRSKSDEFLRNLSSSTLDDNEPDYHFMSDAYRCIQKWFEAKTETDLSYDKRFWVKLMSNVQVIWYDVELLPNSSKSLEEQKIDIFNRLNIGKIPLEDAELVRALLMSKVDANSEREKLIRQAEFSNEWYEIEHWLQQPEQWLFLTDKKYANHIQLIFELMAHNNNSENYSTFKWFEKQIQDSKDPVCKASKLWYEVKEYFAYFRFWLSDRDIYHYVGFLLSANLSKLEELIEYSKEDKHSFAKKLKQLIANYLESTNLDELSYENDQEELKRILLLFNVLSVNAIKANKQSRFPFNLYNEIKQGKKWSLEHIHAQQSQDPLQKDKVIRDWISDTLRSIGRISSIEKGFDDEGNIIVTPLKPLIEELLQLSKTPLDEKVDEDRFNLVRAKIVNAFDSESTKHLLDNMALLSCPDNSRLNNAIFPVKRDRVIEMELEGRFIPPCTRNVFLKIYSKADTQPYFWSKEDKIDYIREINRVFDDFKLEVSHDN